MGADPSGDLFDTVARGLDGLGLSEGVRRDHPIGPLTTYRVGGSAALLVLGGSGEVCGDVDYQGGAISPGNSPGVMEIDGHYSQGADASLLIELAGTDAGLSDLLSVGGIASLSGQISVTLLDGFQPALGDAFDVLAFGGSAGEFKELLLPSLSDGLAWDVSSLYSNGSLSVVPEPASWGLLGVMIAFGVAANRRRV